MPLRQAHFLGFHLICHETGCMKKVALICHFETYPSKRWHILFRLFAVLIQIFLKWWRIFPFAILWGCKNYCFWWQLMPFRLGTTTAGSIDKGISSQEGDKNNPQSKNNATPSISSFPLSMFRPAIIQLIMTTNSEVTSLQPCQSKMRWFSFSFLHFNNETIYVKVNSTLVLASGR